MASWLPGVVQVVLAAHLGTLAREQVRDGVAHRHPAAAAGVQRPGGVGRDELEVDPPAGERAVRAVGARPPRPRRAAPRGASVGRRWKLRKPGPGDLDVVEVRHAGPFELGGDRLGDLSGLARGALGELEGYVRREVAVGPLAGHLERQLGGRWQPGGGDCGAQRGEELVTHHELPRLRSPAARRRAGCESCSLPGVFARSRSTLPYCEWYECHHSPPTGRCSGDHAQQDGGHGVTHHDEAPRPAARASAACATATDGAAWSA